VPEALPLLSRDERRTALRRWLQLAPSRRETRVEVQDVVHETSFERRRVVYASPDGDRVPAFLLVPKDRRRPGPAVLIHHQHNGERHLGKSEVCGLAGNPLQAFGVALVERGLIVLAPDSICFEDRRAGHVGVEPAPGDWQQHYDEMTYRLVRGDTLMRKVLDDASAGISMLAALDLVDPERVGVLGHSYGGNTVLFQAALDERVAFACSSGAACSYRHKLAHGTAIEMAEVIPNTIGRFDIDDLLRLIAPRPMLVLSAPDDPYSADGAELVRLAQPAYDEASAHGALEHAEHGGGHAVTPERFDRIVRWIDAVASGDRGDLHSRNVR
jgi:dienelactone hydrolase